MLVLSRREGEQVKIGDGVTITVVRLGGDKVRIGIDAPSDVLILRGELEQREKIVHNETVADEVIHPFVPLPNTGSSFGATDSVHSCVG